MKLRDFLLQINKIVEEDPKNLELEVIYSIDDEGNAFHKIAFTPSLGYYDNDLGEFDQDHYVNAICIN